MESGADYTECLKTPRRTRRFSVQSTEPTSQNKPSTRKSALKEVEGVSLATEPVTPGRASRVLSFQTPSRSEAITAAQTPRRSVRKSVKPVQEYENIVAQKGVNIKRAASSSVEIAEEMGESKWEPAVIGRISSKRGRKTKRGKQLKRQRRIEDEDEKDKQSTNETENKKDLMEEKIIDKNKDNKPESAIEKDSLEQVSSLEKDVSTDEKDEHKLESETTQEECKGVEARKTEKTNETSSGKADISGNQSDISIADGDVELATIPVTADDCMDGLEAPTVVDTLRVVEGDCIEIRETLSPSIETATYNSLSRADDSDCIMLSLNDSSRTDSSECEAEKIETNMRTIHDSAASTETNMPSLLLCSDDEEEVVDKVPETEKPASLTPTDNKTEIKEIKEEAPIPDQNEETVNLNSTFDADIPESSSNIAEPHTPLPQLRPSTSHTPTPFKSAMVTIPDIVIEPEEEIESDRAPGVVVEPRETKLRGSRKRSFTICTDRPKKMVTFYSPANTTVSIYEGDLMQSLKNESCKENNPQRRKRSLSATETEKEIIAYFEERKATETPDKRKKAAQLGSKIKMPNFAAIHQQHFQRMESICEHVARKAERAKILSNSATKVRPTSIQKGLPIKNTILRDFNKDGISGRSALPIPKARQRIELSDIANKPKMIRSKSKQQLSSFNDHSSHGKIPSKTTTLNTTTKPSLPKPTAQSQATSKFTTSFKPTASTFNITVASTSANSQSVLPDPRHRFNLSTAIDSVQVPKTSDKLNDRRKRLMDMYKSRGIPRTGERSKEILKGVRTNRRFELQMMCRNRPS